MRNPKWRLYRLPHNDIMVSLCKFVEHITRTKKAPDRSGALVKQFQFCLQLLRQHVFQADIAHHQMSILGRARGNEPRCTRHV